VSKNFIVLEVSHGLVKRLKAIQRRIYLFEWIFACKIPAKNSMSVMDLAGDRVCENRTYFTIWKILQKCGILLGWCLTVKN
jgi:hypothetical protein